MKFFRKPVVAVILSCILVIASTLISVNRKLDAKADEVRNGFYTGVKYNGYMQKPIASHLQNINDYAEGLATIARNYDIEVDDVEEACEDLRLSLNYSREYASFIYSNYVELNKAVNTMVDQLLRTELNERDASGVQQYADNIAGARNAIESAGYNESVREFLRKFDRLPTNILAKLAGVGMPEYFA